MEGPQNHTKRQAAAIVVRQFVPNRIERQLLDQIFHLVCREKSVPDDQQSASHELCMETLDTRSDEVTISRHHKRIAA